MKHFDSHTLITKGMALYLLISHIVVMGLFIVGISAFFELSASMLAVLLLGLPLGTIGLFLGYSLLKRRTWALTGCFWFFLLQAFSFETENYGWELNSGFQLFVSYEVASIVFGMNIIAAVLLVLAIVARAQVLGKATNNAMESDA